MLNKVCVLTIRVPNLEEAIDFYSNVLRFKVSKYYGANIASLQHGDIPIVLEKSEGVYQKPQQNVLLGVISTDLDKDTVYFKEKGVTVLFNEARPCPPGRYNIIEDPAGNQIEIVEFTN
ncbi:VOC family protein [Bacillus sp. Bva_UNVM-123]|uniref:VOC family protein n=1 Tax=Bacillus sp. Bva_UNVM-123 TaxID=2829798 RepID=UPI00391FA4A2